MLFRSHGSPAPKRCPDRSCTAREGAGHCSLLDSQPTPQKEGDERLLDREDLSRGLRAKEAEQERRCPSWPGARTGSRHKLLLLFPELSLTILSFILPLPHDSCETLGQTLHLLGS